MGLEDPDGGVTMVGVGVLEGYEWLFSGLPKEDNRAPLVDMHAGQALKSAIAEWEYIEVYVDLA